jgi:putative ABC transport system permease protein
MNINSLRYFVQLITLGHLRRQKLRALLSMIGVVTGVAAFILSPALLTTIDASLRLTISDLAGRTQAEVRSIEMGFDVGLLDVVRQTEGVSAVAPVSQSGGLVVGQQELLIFFGIDPQIDREFRTYSLAQGEFLSGVGSVLLTETYAQEKGIQVGDEIRLVSAGGFRALTVVGTLAGDEGLGRMNGGDVLVLGIEDALALRGSEQLDSISIIAAEGQEITTLIDTLRASLPDSVVVDNPSSRLKGTDEFGLLINLLMNIVSSMILGLASVLIYNAINVSVAQRRAEIGLLRALGMKRSEVRWLFVLEAGVLGLIAALLGIPLGYALVTLASGLPVLPQFSNVQTLTTQAEISVPIFAPFVALAAGVLIPMLAGYLASRAAAKVDPVEALMQVRAENGAMAFARWRWVVASVILIAVILWRLLFKGNMQLTVAMANLALFSSVIPGVLILPPLIVMLGKALLNLMHRAFGITGMLAASSLTRRPKRIAATAILMMLGMGGGVIISQSNFGYTDFIEEWNSGENVGELTVTGAGANPFAPLYGVPAEVVEEISARPDVAGIVSESIAALEQDGIAYGIRAIDIAAFRELGGRFAWNTGDENTAYQRLLDTEHPAILIGTGPVVLNNNLQVGSTITLPAPNGTQTFEIVGMILGAVETDRLTVVMNRPLYTQLWDDEQVDRLQIALQPEADIQAARRELLRDYAMQGIVTYDSSEVRAAFMKQMISISNVSKMMTVLCLVIMVGGLGSTIYVMVIDRRREIGMLRAVGMLRKQITQSIVLEAVILLVICAVVGIPTGMLVMSMQAAAMQNVMGIRFALSTYDVTVSVAILALTSLIAAYFPARRAGQTNILEAMHYE